MKYKRIAEDRVMFSYDCIRYYVLWNYLTRNVWHVLKRQYCAVAEGKNVFGKTRAAKMLNVARKIDATVGR